LNLLFGTERDHSADAIDGRAGDRGRDYFRTVGLFRTVGDIQGMDAMNVPGCLAVNASTNIVPRAKSITGVLVMPTRS